MENNLLFIFFTYAKRYVPQLIFGLFGLFLSSFSFLYMGRILGSLIDNYMNFDSESYLLFFSVLFLFLLGSFIRSYVFNFYSRKIVWDIASSAYKSIINMHMGFFDQKNNVSIITNFSSHVSSLSASLGNYISFSIRYIITFSGSILMMLMVSSRFTLYFFCFFSLILMALFFAKKIYKNFNYIVENRIKKINEHVSESIMGIRTIQAYVKEDHVYNIFSHSVNQMLKYDSMRLLLKSLVLTLIFISFFIFIGLFFFMTRGQIYSGNITTGEVVSFIFYSALSIASLIGLLEVFSGASGLHFAFSQLVSFLHTKKLGFGGDGLIDTNLALNFTFKDVYLNFSDFNALSGINISFIKKTKIAIVGRSGCGKSSICNLLLRFYDPTKGSIIIANQNINNLNTSELRKIFGFVGGDAFILSDSVKNNIVFGSGNCSDKSLSDAIEISESSEFINKLKEGINYKLEYGGPNLSSGQKQRLMIARCIFSNKPVIIFDEATSALDFHTERCIMNNIIRHYNFQFFIVVTHRINAIRDFDSIIVVSGGKVDSIGKHNELLEKSHLYKSLVKSQNENN